MALEAVRRHFSVAEYNAMAKAGILRGDERVELLDGDVIVSPPQGPPHFSVVARIADVLRNRLDARALVTAQLPIILSDRSEPEPDVAVLVRREDFYRTALPRPADVFAVVEVASSSLPLDRGRKAGVYARAGIADYWIADVGAGAIEIRRTPDRGTYTDVRVAAHGQSVALLAFPDVTFTVDELMGPDR